MNITWKLVYLFYFFFHFILSSSSNISNYNIGSAQRHRRLNGCFMTAYFSESASHFCDGCFSTSFPPPLTFSCYIDEGSSQCVFGCHTIPSWHYFNSQAHTKEKINTSKRKVKDLFTHMTSVLLFSQILWLLSHHSTDCKKKT